MRGRLKYKTKKRKIYFLHSIMPALNLNQSPGRDVKMQLARSHSDTLILIAF